MRPPRDEAEPPPFAAPEWAEPLEVEVLEPGETHRRHSHDPATGAHEVEFEWDVGGHRRLVEAGTEMHDTNVTTYRIVDGDPLSAEVHVRCSSALGRGDWHDARGDRQPHDLDRDRVPRHPAPRRLRGRGAGLLAHVGAGVPRDGV